MDVLEVCFCMLKYRMTAWRSIFVSLWQLCLPYWKCAKKTFIVTRHWCYIINWACLTLIYNSYNSFIYGLKKWHYILPQNTWKSKTFSEKACHQMWRVDVYFKQALVIVSHGSYDDLMSAREALPFKVLKHFTYQISRTIFMTTLTTKLEWLLQHFA